MPAHRQVFAYLARLLASTSDPVLRDRLLDQWLAARNMATDWDAAAWGFPPRWCARQRRELMRRARHSLDAVQLDDVLGSPDAHAP